VITRVLTEAEPYTSALMETGIFGQIFGPNEKTL
jgi:hypothetical protein